MSVQLPRINVLPPIFSTTIATVTQDGLDNSARYGMSGSFLSPDTTAITRVCIPYVSKVGTTPTYIVSLQGVDASGKPDGTIKGGGSPASVTFNPSSLGWSDNTMQTLTLDNAYTPARGEIITVVIEHDSGTINTSNCANFVFYGGMSLADGFAYYATTATPSWSAAANSSASVGYGTASEIRGTPTMDTGLVSINSTGVAIKFTVPTTMAASTLTIAGTTLLATGLGSDELQITLYSGGGSTDRTILQQSSRDGDALRKGPAIAMFDEASLSELTAGNTYRLEFSAPSGGWSMWEIDAGDSDCRKPWAGPWNAFKSTWGGSSWTDDEAKVLSVQDLIIGSMTASGGGGGGGRRPRLQTLC